MVNRSYMIYFRDGRYMVCDESFGTYIREDEIVKRGIAGCLDAEIEAGYMQIKLMERNN